ncbi:hypothetical protein PCANC_23094 [Puccinia coronata f. sp. avenae]|uniref:Uncharacterized protein n=1 Tax=Puccinia coronata f. sp. avenae TaxID=200324 RepID=A0A2N5TMP4_9BASI|nr:hypothetical protein PCASD_26587 [Puccinia coronata f. sp. avenae]PLW33355.1 hypothetical protein PCANC_23094 [Puccinia coronata f. sp. avenae]
MSVSLPPPPPLDKEEEEGKKQEEILEIITETAPKRLVLTDDPYDQSESELLLLPPSIHGGKALSTSQLDLIEFLQAAWKAYKKAQGDEEWDLLPRYIQTVIVQFQLVRSFLLWNETTNKIGGINPYTKQKIAKSWAEMKGKVPPPKKNPSETSVKKGFQGYNIPKKSQGKENKTEGMSLTKKGPLKRTRRFKESQDQQAGPSKKQKENKLSLEKTTKAAIKKEIRDQVDQLHEDNDNSSVHQEAQKDNNLAILSHSRESGKNGERDEKPYELHGKDPVYQSCET